MKIALASQVSEINIEINFKLIKSIMIELKQKVDLICFGEAFLHGFDALSWNYEQDKKIAISLESDYIKDIQLVAKHHQIAVSFGFYELFEDTIFCSYLFIDKGGVIINHYRRVSPGWKEITKCDNHYQEGKSFSTFNYMEKDILVAICGDLWDDNNLSRINKLKKDLVLWPLHIDYEIEQWEKEFSDYLLQTEKLNKPVLMINNISKTSYGGCYYYHGKVVKSLSMGIEGFLIQDI